MHRTRRWWRQARNFAKRPFGDQWLFIQTFVLLGVARFAILTLSFPRLAQFMGTLSEESPRAVSAVHLQQARRVAWAIRKVSAHTPWTSNCFPQALTATLMLRRRGIGATVYMGAAFREDGSGLIAHAWSRCGSLYLTGGDGAGEYGAVTSYA